MKRAIWTIGVISVLALLTFGCEDSAVRKQRETARRNVATRAREQLSECKRLGDQAFSRTGTCIVWDLSADNSHGAEAMLDDAQVFSGTGPVTVFLISAKRSQQMGTYSVSRQPAFREWVDVSVVVFSDSNGSGKAIGTHEVVSLDPRSRRPVSYSPEHGDPTKPIADWIKSLRGN